MTREESPLETIETAENEITLSLEQIKAKEAFDEWWGDKSRNKTYVFRIFGFAGTGKTVLTKYIIENLYVGRNQTPANVIAAAYTGKAALVLSRAGVPARTIHSTIYIPEKMSLAEVLELKELIDKEKNPEARKELQVELDEGKKLRFVLNDKSLLNEADLFVLDECSMVDDVLLADINFFGVPLLVLGDPGQLPPIKGAGALTNVKPDVMLTEIHRQALDNPIIKLSIKARERGSVGKSFYGASKCIPIAALKDNDFLAADQILTGKNKIRRGLNQLLRKLHGYSGTFPQPGEKLICLRNIKGRPIFNGSMGTVLTIGKDRGTTIDMELQFEDLANSVVLSVFKAYFIEYENPGFLQGLDWWDLVDGFHFDFGYAITVHKAQGSQYGKVLVYDDAHLVWKKQERKQWLYTAITRAIDSITIGTK